MAIVQISRIQHRRGLSTDLPRPNLAEGELGFTLDTGELFIGAPNFPPVVGRENYPYQNLRVLTEFSVRDLISTLLYVYRWQDRHGPDSAAFPGIGSYQADPGLTIERLLQERLDEIVSVKSYGAKGNGVDDDTQAINNACKDIYTDQYKRSSPKILYFPAGVYVIDSELLLFSGTRWVGDGKDRTIIFQSNTSANSVVETAQWVNSTTINTGESIIGVVENIFISGMSLARGNVGDILRLNRAHTGTFMDLDLKVANLTFQPNETYKLTPNETWKNSLQTGETLTGYDWTVGTKYDAAEHGVCVRIDRLSKLSPTVYRSTNFNFIDCIFGYNTYGLYAIDAVDNINIICGKFSRLFKGVTLGEAIYYSSSDLNVIGDFAFSLPFDKDASETYDDWDPTGNYSPVPGPWGPAGVKIVNSTFSDIMDVPYSVFSNRSGNISSGNQYTRYGWSTSEIVSEPLLDLLNRVPVAPAIFYFKDQNNLSAAGSPGNDIVHYNHYLAQNNSSVGDTFDFNGHNPGDNRFRVFLQSNINIVNNVQDPINSPNGIVNGILHQTAMSPVATILDLGSNPVVARTNGPLPLGAPLPVFDITEQNSIILDYTINYSGFVRKGQLHIIASGTSYDWYEQVIDTAGSGIYINNVVLTVNMLSLDIQILTPLPGQTAIMHWAVRTWDHAFNTYNP